MHCQVYTTFLILIRLCWLLLIFIAEDVFMQEGSYCIFKILQSQRQVNLENVDLNSV